jgi:hypothetical protein
MTPDFEVLIIGSGFGAPDRPILPSNEIVISTGGVMGLHPTQGDEKCLGPASVSMAPWSFPLSSRPTVTF